MLVSKFFRKIFQLLRYFYDCFYPISFLLNWRNNIVSIGMVYIGYGWILLILDYISEVRDESC